MAMISAVCEYEPLGQFLDIDKMTRPRILQCGRHLSINQRLAGTSPQCSSDQLPPQPRWETLEVLVYGFFILLNF